MANIDRKLTSQLQKWLDSPAESRDIALGASLVRRLTGNIVLADNLQRLPGRFMKMCEYQLRKFLPMRLKEITHEDMVRMTGQVRQINRERGLDRPLPGSERTAMAKRIAKTDDFRLGKRPDHAKLPEEIRACYSENLSIMQNMRACHAQLVILSRPENISRTCPDGDRYPFVKEIIELDAKYHANWQKYDSYPPVGE